MLERLRRIPWLALATGVASAVALVLAVIVLASSSDLSQRNCRQIQHLYARIQTVVGQGQRTLGEPGSAGYAYYLEHPAELAQARRSGADAIRTFAPQPCP